MSKDYAAKNGISENEAFTKLYNSAMYAVDADARNNIAALSDKQIKEGFISATGDSLTNINKNINYLRSTSKDRQITDSYYESMNSQNYYTATKQQFNNSDYQPDSSVSLEDTSLMLVPTTRVATKVADTTVILGKATTKKADEIILNTEIKTDNFIQNTAVPVVKDGYYRTANAVLYPENVVKAVGAAEIVNDVILAHQYQIQLKVLTGHY